MCHQIIERYIKCHCLYSVHAVDRCSKHGQRGHSTIERVVLVGYICPNHDKAYSGLRVVGLSKDTNGKSDNNMTSEAQHFERLNQLDLDTELPPHLRHMESREKEFSYFEQPEKKPKKTRNHIQDPAA